MAQQESESISSNIHLGIKYRNEKGKVRVNHNWFLGYTKDEEGRLVIDEEQAAIVRRIYAEYLQGKSCIQIVRGLEADGIKNGAGKTKWNDSNIRQILTNEKYVGDAILQKTVTTNVLKHKREKNDGSKAPQYYVSESHEAIIPRETFAAVEREMRKRAATGEDGKKKYYNARNALGGVMICASCGSPFRRHSWTIHGRKEIVWRCRERVVNGPESCMARTIKETDLKDAILSAIETCYADRDADLPLIREEMEREIAGSNAAMIQSLEEKLEELQKTIITLEDEFEQEKVGNQIREIRSELAELRSLDDDNSGRLADLAALEELLKAERCVITEYSDEIVRRYIDSITVYDYSITIRMNSGKEISMQV